MEAEAKKPLEPIQSPEQSEKEYSPQEFANILKEWEVVIQTQMHFNDLIMKVRTATVSTVLAVFGAAAYSLQFEALLLIIKGVPLHASAIVVFIGVLILGGMFAIDYFYYYKMLIGAVKRGYEIDNEFKDKRGRKRFGMTTMISQAIGKTNLSRYFVILFYSLPILGGAGFLVYIILGHLPSG